MKKIILSAFLIAALSFFSNGQHCATMENLQEMIKNDSSLAQRMNEIEEQTQEWIKNNPQSRLHLTEANYEHYQVIPGFTVTGNPKVDAVNYLKAKEELRKNNPKEYKKLFTQTSSKTASDKKIERQKKKHRKQMIKKEKNTKH